jgi:hypothetical protein
MGTTCWRRLLSARGGGSVKRTLDYKAEWLGKLGFWQVVRDFFCAVIRRNKYSGADDFRSLAKPSTCSVPWWSAAILAQSWVAERLCSLRPAVAASVASASSRSLTKVRRFATYESSSLTLTGVGGLPTHRPASGQIAERDITEPGGRPQDAAENISRWGGRRRDRAPHGQAHLPASSSHYRGNDCRRYMSTESAYREPSGRRHNSSHTLSEE